MKNPSDKPLKPGETNEIPKPVFDKDGKLLTHSEIQKRKKADLWLPASLATEKEGLPKCPEGWDAAKWWEGQCKLRNSGAPMTLLRKVNTGRRMNKCLLAEQFPSSIYFQWTWGEVEHNLDDDSWFNRFLIFMHQGKGKA